MSSGTVGLRRFREGGWEWIERRTREEGPEAGVYQFFGTDRPLLVDMAEQEVRSGVQEIFCARVSIEPVSGNTEYALELYGRQGSLEALLAGRLAGGRELRYAGWRGKGVSAAEFLRKLCTNKQDLPG